MSASGLRRRLDALWTQRLCGRSGVCRRLGVTFHSSFSTRVARLIVGVLCAVSVCAVVVVSSNQPVAAAPCPGCLVVSAPTISLTAIARPGGQPVINTRLGVAVYTPLTTGSVGGPGTVWLAGHRTTYGGVFNQVPFLKSGDPINLIDDAGAHQYIVSRLLIVPANGWQNYVDIHDNSRSMLIVQTSHRDSRLRYLIEAFGKLPVPCRTTPLVMGGPALSQETTRFVPIAPQRLIDTRTDGAGALCAGGNLELQITGALGISEDATAVALNVTATENAGPGLVWVGPAGVDPGSTSALNISGVGQTRANLVMVAVGRSGRIALHVSTTTHLIVDVAGYFVPSSSTNDGRFVGVEPERLLDSRTDPAQHRLRARQTITVDIDDRTTQLPVADASAVVLNVTAVSGGSRGYVTVWQDGMPRPSTSNVNLSSVNDTAANLVIVPVGADGVIQLFASTNLDLIIDVVGYFTDASAGFSTEGLFVPLSVRRALDTRTTNSHLSAGSTNSFNLLGSSGVIGPVHVVAILTSTRNFGRGFVAVTDGGIPSTSNLNVSSSENRGNLAIFSVASTGVTQVYTSLSTHLVVDITGYFTSL